jgi:hypothetical protein
MYEEDTPPYKTIVLLEGVSTEDEDFYMFDYIKDVSMQVERLHKAIQACYETGIAKR